MNRPGCYLDITGRLAAGSGGVVYRLGLTDGEPSVLKTVIGADGVHNPLEIDVSMRFRHPNLLPGLGLYIPSNGDDCFNRDEFGIVYPLMVHTGYDLFREEPAVGEDR